MIKIKYNDETEYRDVSFSKLSDHVVSLKNSPQNTSGFLTFRMNGDQLGDFSSYTTVYRVLTDEVQYSNDGSVWVDRETEEKVYGPTQLDRIEAQALYTALMTDTLIEEV